MEAKTVIKNKIWFRLALSDHLSSHDICVSGCTGLIQRELWRKNQVCDWLHILQSKLYFILTVRSLATCGYIHANIKTGLQLLLFCIEIWPPFTKAHLPEHRAPATRRSLCLKIFIALPDGSSALLIKLVQVGTHPVTLVTAAECTMALLSVIRPTDLWARSHPSHLHTNETLSFSYATLTFTICILQYAFSTVFKLQDQVVLINSLINK